MDTSKRSIRVAMFPWLAHGHISPFLELARSLAKRNFVTYICSSPINLNPIKSNLSPKDSISIKLVELQIPTTEELPPHYHTTNGLPPHLMAPLKKALDGARPAFSTLLTTLKPDLFLYDFLQPWAAEEAAAQDIPAVVFLSTGAAASSRISYHWFEPGSEYPFPNIDFRENERDVYRHLVMSDDSDRVKECINRSSEIVLIKAFEELEGKYIGYLSDLTQKKFVPVGPLIHDIEYSNSETQQNEDIIKWLDGKHPRSTIFASFGSEYFLSDDEIQEIACGLELSGVNFIWVVRFPAYCDRRMEIAEKLPIGFLERVGDRGMVVEGWAPQRRILSHPNVGGFLSHCGWSSVMEAVHSGVPIVAAPMHLDQPLNARLVEAAALGEKLVRSREGKLEREEVARVVREVVLGRGGEEARRSVAEMSERMREKGEAEIDGVVAELVRLCGRKERVKLERENSMKRLSIMIRNHSREGMSSENA